MIGEDVSTMYPDETTLNDYDPAQEEGGEPSIGARILEIPGPADAAPPPDMAQAQDSGDPPSSSWRMVDAQRQQQMMAAPAKTPEAAMLAQAAPPARDAAPAQSSPPQQGRSDRPSAPANSSDIRMIDRQGNITTVPRASVNDARSNGKMVTPDNGVRMITPDGQITYALPEEVNQFRAAGHVLLNDNGYFKVEPLPGENMVETMARAARIAKNLPPDVMNQALAAEKKTFTAKRIAGTLAAAPLIGAAGTGALVGAGELIGPVGVADTVGTGLYDAAGREIMRDAVRYGPGLLQRVAATKAAKWAGGIIATGAAKAYFDHLLDKWKGKK
ncbi:MAG TPA: hypothetical protein VNW97_14415 [Candidatus Saccharimonadales bacterium]|jgi:hypothetical protein|nr:hypothetical protein [Candidatus Saccharimonadales bacterium]